MTTKTTVTYRVRATLKGVTTYTPFIYSNRGQAMVALSKLAGRLLTDGCKVRIGNCR